MLNTIKRVMSEYYEEQSYFTGRFKSSNSKPVAQVKTLGIRAEESPSKIRVLQASK